MQDRSLFVSPGELCHLAKGYLSIQKAAVVYRSLLAAGIAVLTCGGGPLDELPIPTPPPDPLSLLDALRPRLPPNWRMGQPTDYLGITEVRVNILDEWQGNPVAAAISMCPDPEDEIWKQIRVFRLIMRHHQRDWPPYECRP